MARAPKPAPQATYPFVPKSTASLLPGQFWSIPLPGGFFGCGRVLSLKIDAQDRVDSRAFLAGLMDWIGSEPPTADALAGVRVIEPAIVHIKTIHVTGGAILGHRELALDGNEPGFFLTACYGGDLCRGAVYQRKATDADLDEIPVLSTSGYSVMQLLAEDLALRRVNP